MDEVSWFFIYLKSIKLYTTHSILFNTQIQAESTLKNHEIYD